METKTIRQTITFKAPPHDIYEALMDSRKHAKFTGECGKFVLWEGPSTLNKGFDGKIIYPIHIPEEALPGTCEFRIHSRYFCNPIDWFSTDQSFDSDPIDFKVLPE